MIAPSGLHANGPHAGTPLRVLIVDDERLARQRVRRLLGTIPDVQVVGESTSGGEALDAVRRLSPDLLLLDVQMPEMDGFGVLARLTEPALAPKTMPLVVFVTAFDEYALRAFDVHAVDYVLKPIDAKRLGDAVARARATRRT